MREILFRGKRVRNGEWIYGSPIAMDSDISSSQVFIFPPYKGASSLPCSFLVSNNMADVAPETIGQYTGLTDKNGKKIFEGDIIRGLDGGIINTPRIVRWDEHHFAFKCPLVNEHWAFGRNDCPLCLIQEIAEVIGNIHDNPELLGGADNGE